MTSKTIRLISILMLVTIIVLFVTQMYWFKKSFSLEEKQFDNKVNIALRSVAHTLLTLTNNTKATIPPITKTASNEFLVKTNTHFSITTLDSLLKKEFLQREITVSYDYSLVEPESQQTILGSTVPNIFESYEIICQDRDMDSVPFDFKVRINNKTTYLVNSMEIWLYSSATLLMIFAVFIFIILSIIKEKKLSLLKKDFVNNMTHELKTPITNISVASDAIRKRDDMDYEKMKKYAEIIYKENLRLHTLVDKVLQISTIEKRGESLIFKEINIHTIIKDIIESFQPIIQQKKGYLHYNLDASSFLLKADETHLTNVIYNLIDNAIKYSKVHPEITLTTKNHKNGILIEVKDNGIGMNKETQQRIFEKFFRAETGNVHNTKGYGLGLSYVKIIIEKHLGNITFNSTQDIGSSFKIYLPS